MKLTKAEAKVLKRNAKNIKKLQKQYHKAQINASKVYGKMNAEEKKARKRIEKLQKKKSKK